MMAMAFNYIPMAPQLKENFWGNFPYTTQLVRDCDTKYMYQTRGDYSAAQNLYARGLEQTNGACTNVNAGVGVKESFDSTYKSTQTTPLCRQMGPVNKSAETIANTGFTGNTVPEQELEMFQKDTREDFTCLLSNNDGRQTLGPNYTPENPLRQFNYNQINPVNGNVPFNSCSGPVICRDRIMYSPGRNRYTAGANPILGDIVVAGEPSVTWTAGAAMPQVANNYLATGGGTGNLSATIIGATTNKEFLNTANGTNFINNSQIQARTSLDKFI